MFYLQAFEKIVIACYTLSYYICMSIECCCLGVQRAASPQVTCGIHELGTLINALLCTTFVHYYNCVWIVTLWSYKPVKAFSAFITFCAVLPIDDRLKVSPSSTDQCLFWKLVGFDLKNIIKFCFSLIYSLFPDNLSLKQNLIKILCAALCIVVSYSL